MECLQCEMEFDEDFYDDCPYCGCSKDAVICPDCESVVDDDVTCSVCGYMLHDQYEDYYAEGSDYDDDFEEEEEDDDLFEEDYGENICENCTYWQVHSHGSAYGMVCQKTGMSTDPGDSCGYFSKMFHFSNYGEEGQYSFIDTEQEKQKKLFYWHNKKF